MKSVHEVKPTGRTGRAASRALIAVGVAACLLGQHDLAAAAAKTRPAPAKAAVPDLSGMWMAKGGSVLIRNTSEGWPPPFRPEALAIFNKTQAAEKRGEPIADNVTNCSPHGVPRIMGAPFPMKIVQTKDEVLMLHEAHHLLRIVYMNEEHPKDLDPTYLGHSVGHWEGANLIVDTVALNTKTVIDRNGITHSDALHVIEKFSLADGGKKLLDYITVDDPKTFTKPWSYTIEFNKRPDIRIMEYVCDYNVDSAEAGATISIGSKKAGE